MALSLGRGVVGADGVRRQDGDRRHERTDGATSDSDHTLPRPLKMLPTVIKSLWIFALIPFAFLSFGHRMSPTVRFLAPSP